MNLRPFIPNDSALPTESVFEGTVLLPLPLGHPRQDPGVPVERGVSRRRLSSVDYGTSSLL
jgi:hypothetical protein